MSVAIQLDIYIYLVYGFTENMVQNVTDTYHFLADQAGFMQNLFLIYFSFLKIYMNEGDPYRQQFRRVRTCAFLLETIWLIVFTTLFFLLFSLKKTIRSCYTIYTRYNDSVIAFQKVPALLRKYIYIQFYSKEWNFFTWILLHLLLFFPSRQMQCPRMTLLTAIMPAGLQHYSIIHQTQVN